MNCMIVSGRVMTMLPNKFVLSEKSKMACHPIRITVDVVGINASDKGRSCEKHGACGQVLALDVFVRFGSVQIEVSGGKEEAVIAIHHVSGRIDTCHVGFL